MLVLFREIFKVVYFYGDNFYENRDMKYFKLLPFRQPILISDACPLMWILFYFIFATNNTKLRSASLTLKYSFKF